MWSSDDPSSDNEHQEEQLYYWSTFPNETADDSLTETPEKSSHQQQHPSLSPPLNPISTTNGGLSIPIHILNSTSGDSNATNANKDGGGGGVDHQLTIKCLDTGHSMSINAPLQHVDTADVIIKKVWSDRQFAGRTLAAQLRALARKEPALSGRLEMAELPPPRSDHSDAGMGALLPDSTPPLPSTTAANSSISNKSAQSSGPSELVWRSVNVSVRWNVLIVTMDLPNTVAITTTTERHGRVSMSEQRLVDSMLLDSCNVHVATDRTNRPFSFIIETGFVDYGFCASSESEMHRWVRQLKQQTMESLYDLLSVEQQARSCLEEHVRSFLSGPRGSREVAELLQGFSEAPKELEEQHFVFQANQRTDGTLPPQKGDDDDDEDNRQTGSGGLGSGGMDSSNDDSQTDQDSMAIESGDDPISIIGKAVFGV